MIPTPVRHRPPTNAPVTYQRVTHEELKPFAGFQREVRGFLVCHLALQLPKLKTIPTLEQPAAGVHYVYPTTWLLPKKAIKKHKSFRRALHRVISCEDGQLLLATLKEQLKPFSYDDLWAWILVEEDLTRGLLVPIGGA